MATDVREIGKGRSQRIELDYYRKPTKLSQLRGLLGLAGLIAAAAYGAYVFASGNKTHLSTGPLAAAHASFENDCNQCHTNFEPIAGDALQLASNGALERLETACQHCHRVDPHYRTAMEKAFAALDQQCSGCHLDHLGRDHDMVNITSATCAQCHQSLKATMATPPSVRVEITAFTEAAHGNFGSLAKDDPGSLKFDHAQHGLPGQVDVGKRGGFQLDMLEPSLRQRYRKPGQADNDQVQLACADCHQFAGAVSTVAAGAGDNEIGRHIAPIRFEEHCAGCHRLDVIGSGVENLPLPHAAPWAEVVTLIAAKIEGGQLNGVIRSPIDGSRTKPVVGEGNGKKVSAEGSSNDAKTNAEGLKFAQAAAQANIEQRCLLCHEAEQVSDEGINRLRLDGEDTLIPSRWFNKGIYDHAAHQKISCKLCHEAAYPPEQPVAKTPADATVVMIGGIETCVGCHRPAELVEPQSLTEKEKLLGGQTKWASDACMECHRYHWQRPTFTTPQPSELPAVASLTHPGAAP